MREHPLAFGSRVLVVFGPLGRGFCWLVVAARTSGVCFGLLSLGSRLFFGLLIVVFILGAVCVPIHSRFPRVRFTCPLSRRAHFHFGVDLIIRWLVVFLGRPPARHAGRVAVLGLLWLSIDLFFAAFLVLGLIRGGGFGWRAVEWS